MKRLNDFNDRLEALEAGYVELCDGTRFRPKHSGLGLVRSMIEAERDLKRKPVLSDFTLEEQDEITNYSKWFPAPESVGAMAIWVTEMSREVVSRSKI